VIILLTALAQEGSGLRRQMKLTPVPSGRAGKAIACSGRYGRQPVLLAWTGMGRQCAEAGSAAILARYQATAVISIGFSGALTQPLTAGTLVLATELQRVTSAGDGKVQGATLQVDQNLLQRAKEALSSEPLHLISGPTVTSPKLLSTPDEKLALGQQSGAIAVDMESYWVARAASERGLPFLALRVISDAQDDPLPPFLQNQDTSASPGTRQIALALIQNPSNLPALFSLARNAVRARRALTRGVACIVAAL
jgi:nucleoside phosphorylase